MRFSNVLFGAVIVFIIGFFLLAICSVVADLNHPEKEILGTWKEVEWHYDKVGELKGSSSVQKDNLTNELKINIRIK
jgi:hypothetical protein